MRMLRGASENLPIRIHASTAEGMTKTGKIIKIGVVIGPRREIGMMRIVDDMIGGGAGMEGNNLRQRSASTHNKGSARVLLDGEGEVNPNSYGQHLQRE